MELAATIVALLIAMGALWLLKGASRRKKYSSHSYFINNFKYRATDIEA